ncbi:MAG: hypothetical protein ACRERD_34205 [Candidatus Binatia bacterium]
MDTPSDKLTEEQTEEFGELIRFTVAGYLGGLAVAAALDYFGQARSAVGQWLVRTLSGEGESILEGLYAFRKRLRGSAGSMAEAYGWGKFIGMIVPWVIDAGSRFAGVDVYAVAGFYIPYFYALSDQIGANVSGFVFLRRRAASTSQAVAWYLRHPVMVVGLSVILVVPVGLLLARVAGFSPSTQILTALETMIANLCWLPPLAGWISERRQR